jgi:hypothetical protein
MEDTKTHGDLIRAEKAKAKVAIASIVREFHLATGARITSVEVDHVDISTWGSIANSDGERSYAHAEVRLTVEV